MPASIPSPSSNGFHLGLLFVHAYGLAYIGAVVAAIAITVRAAGNRASQARRRRYEDRKKDHPCGGNRARDCRSRARPVGGHRDREVVEVRLHAGDGFAGIASPDVSGAANGDTVTIDATGTFRVAGHKASGGGTFVHKAANGTVLATGTFEVERLTSFDPFGCGVAEGHPLPPEFCGGRAVTPVEIDAHPASGGTHELDGLLTITCLVGDRVPPGAEELDELNIPGLIDFNRPVSGENLFVKTKGKKHEQGEGKHREGSDKQDEDTRDEQD